MRTTIICLVLLKVNVRKFKDQLRKNNPELFKSKINTTIITDPDYQKDLALTIEKGGRVELKSGGHRGEVMYVGRVPDKELGYFIGIKLDEPYGKNNGSFNNIPYFNCPNKYGIFVRPSEVNVGDFPELDIDEL